MAPHFSTLAWQIPWMEEPGRLPSMGSRRVGHDWATSLSLFTFMHWRRKWQPTPVFLPGESQGQGSLVGCCLWGRRVRHGWSDAAAAAAAMASLEEIFPVVTYGCERWILKKTGCQRIDVFELWCCRRLLKVSWTARKSNQSILRDQLWIFTGRTDAEA